MDGDFNENSLFCFLFPPVLLIYLKAVFHYVA